jgi:hypothetical protein
MCRFGGALTDMAGRTKSVWEYCRGAWAIWGPAMSGAFSVPFAAAAVFSDQKYGPLIWGAMAYCALLFMGYLLFRRVQNLEERLRPKLSIFFDARDPICLHETFIGADESDRVLYIAVVPNADAEAAIAGSIGWLVDVRKLAPDNKTWEPTSFNTRLALEWSAIGFVPVDINQGTRQALNIVRISDANVQIIPCVHQLLNKDAHIFDDHSGIFRLDLVVVGQNCPPAKFSLRLQRGATWNKPNVEAI